MNTTKAKNQLISDIEQENYLQYPDGTDINNGERVLAYGLRRDRGKHVSWEVKNIVPEQQGFVIGKDIEFDDGRQQLLLSGVISVSSSIHGSEYEFSDVQVCQSEPIAKCKDEIKHKFVQLYHLGFSDKYVIDSTLTDIDMPFMDQMDVRPLTEDDIKITTIRSKGKSMHLGRSSDTDYLYKLGVNWVSWHFSEPTYTVRALTHELCHCLHPHHKKSFFTEHAQLIDSLTGSAVRKKRVERLFDGDIQWNKLKTLTMEGVHDQPKDIDTSGFQHRRGACNAVIGGLENILDYRHAVGRTFHTQPPTKSIKPRWVMSYSHDGSGEHPSREELCPNGIEKRSLAEISVDETVSDEELYTFLQEELAEERESGISDFVYEREQIPVVEQDGTVVRNPKLVQVFKRMVNESGIITENQFSADQRVFVRPASDS